MFDKLSSPTIAFKMTQETRDLQQKLLHSINEVNKLILGKSKIIELIFVSFFSDGHLLLNDNPGMGKTSTAKWISFVLGLNMKRIQFTSDLMPSDIIGINILSKNTIDNSPTFNFQKGPVFTHILLADEINRSPPRTQSALLEAMEEHSVSLDGQIYSLPDPFWVIATQNPVDLYGTFPLPLSQMDRFMFQLSLGYPDKENECKLYKTLNQNSGVQSYTSRSLNNKENLHNESRSMLLNNEDIVKIKKHINKQMVSDNIIQYIYRLIYATRNHKSIKTGLSPRSGLSLIKAAKTLSWMEGRSYVTPSDIQKLFNPIASHRLVLSEYENNDSHKLLNSILDATPINE